MSENQLHHTSPEETGRVRPADDLSNSVQITLANFAAAAAGSATATVASDGILAQRAVRTQDVPYDFERNTKSAEKWLLTAGVLSVTTLFTSLYSIRNRDMVPNFINQTVSISEQLSANIVSRFSTPRGGKAVQDTAEARDGTDSGAAAVPDAPADRSPASAVQPKSVLASDKGGTGTSENTRRRAHNDNRNARRFAGESGGEARSQTEMPKKGYMVPPPPPTPYSLPPAFNFFSMQPAQQQAQTHTVPKTHNQEATTDASESAALGAADQDMQAALNSSVLHKSEWTR